MSDLDDFGPGERRILEAAEYVLGVLSADARAAASARVESDAAFAADVAWWEAQFAPLLGLYPEVEPSAGLWARIERQIGESAGTGAPPQAANDAGGVAPWWRVYGIGMSAVAAVLLAVLLIRPPEIVSVPTPVEVPAEPQPAPAAPLELLSARVAPEEGIPVAVITYDPGSRRLIVSPVSIAAGARQTPELWFIPAGGTPRSLGTIAPADGISVSLPSDFSPDSTLAISIEPEGGSPTGAPTGPIVGTGTLEEI